LVTLRQTVGVLLFGLIGQASKIIGEKGRRFVIAASIALILSGITCQ